MQQGKTNKFTKKLGLALCMLPLSSWAVSSATLDASPLPAVSFHETKDIEATAQSPRKRTITGTITDASDGTPIIGANIVLKGKSTGVISDLDGNILSKLPAKTSWWSASSVIKPVRFPWPTSASST